MFRTDYGDPEARGKLGTQHTRWTGVRPRNLRHRSGKKFCCWKSWHSGKKLIISYTPAVKINHLSQKAHWNMIGSPFHFHLSQSTKIRRLCIYFKTTWTIFYFVLKGWRRDIGRQLKVVQRADAHRGRRVLESLATVRPRPEIRRSCASLAISPSHSANHQLVCQSAV